MSQCYLPLFTSPCRHFIISHHRKKGEYRTRYFERERERDNIHMPFTTLYGYNYSILLLVIINHLLCLLIYKLNFIIGVYV